jgi:FRG domain
VVTTELLSRLFIPAGRMRDASEQSLVWYRGHSGSHMLTPSLFRFRHGLERERQLFERFAHKSSNATDRRLADWLTVIEMHHSYAPTRLLAWTDSIEVALFCALVRESETKCVYVLDPIRLNRLSSVNGVIELKTAHEFDYRSVYLSDSADRLVHPVAVMSPLEAAQGRTDRSLFTVHGAAVEPLEDQCPESIFKVVLDKAAQEWAEDIVLSIGELKCDEIQNTAGMLDAVPRG